MAMNYVYLTVLFSAIQLILTYKQPEFKIEPKDVYGVEKKSVTLDCSASGEPAPQYRWKKNAVDVKIDGTKFQRGTNGNLIINDFSSKDVGKYTCIVSVSVVQSNALLKLRSREAHVQLAAFPSSFAVDIKDMTAYENGAARLVVDYSNFKPQPKIAWNYRGKPTITSNDPRFYILPNGVLQISDLRTSDQGAVRAIAKSPITGETMSGKFAEFTVNSAPSRPSIETLEFLGTPTSISIAWGQSTILEAFASGPQPITYTWYKDDQLISLGGDKSIVGKGNLKILFAKEEDSGVYKVIVTSSRGQTKSASCTLSVITPPRFEAVPPKRMNAIQGGSVTFQFKVTGSPKLHCYHDGVKIDASADYVEFKKDYITIKKLILSDAGMYELRASNEFGETQTSLELLVMEAGSPTQPPISTAPPPTPSKPRNLQAFPLSPTEIQVSWKEPTLSNGGITGYEIIYFSSKEISATNTKILKVGSDLRSTVISGLTPGTSYSFKLQAFNQAGPSPLSDVITTSTKDQSDPPSKVVNLGAKVNGNTLTISWNNPTSGPTPDSFKVYYVDVDVGGNPQSETTTQLSIALSGLPTGSTYQYYVVPFKNGLAGKKSDVFNVFIPEEPKQAPGQIKNLMVDSVLPNLVEVKWDPSDTGAVPTSYVLFYRDMDDLSTPLRKFLTEKTTAIIQRLKAFTKYEFYVVPYNKEIPGLKSKIETITTSQEAPPAPKNLQPVSIGSKSILLKWDPIPSFGGQLSSYRMQIFEPGSKVTTTRSFNSIPGSLTEFKISDLKPETDYNIILKAVSGGGASSPSDTFKVTTREVTDQGPSMPTDFTAVNHPNNPDIIMLKFQPPLYVSGEVNSYVVFYRPQGESSFTSRTLPFGARGYNITKFTAGKIYEAYVVAVDKNGQGGKTSTLAVPTLTENSVPPPPLKVNLIPKADSLSVSWEPPSELSGVVVRGYRVSVSAKQSYQPNNVYSGLLLGRSNNRLKLYNGIKPSTEYDVTVQSFNDVDSSAPIKVSGVTLPAPKPSILVTSVVEKPNSISFKWTDSSLSSNTVPDYLVSYTTYDVNGVAKAHTKATDKPEITIDDLTAYTNYNFFVKRKKDVNFPPEPTLEARTLEAVPSAPLDITARGVPKYPTWLVLSWQVPRYPNGKIKHYVILYSTNKNLPYNEWPKYKTKDASMTYNVSGLTAGTNYFFVVYGVNGAGEGAKSVIHPAATGGAGALPVNDGSGGVIVLPGSIDHHHDRGDGGFDLWWIILFIVLLILMILLLLLLIYCCCCRRKKGAAATCWACCPCCKLCWLKCCLPCCLCCCPCCCKKHRKSEDKKAYIATPITIASEEKSKNGHVTYAAPPDLWMTGKKDQLEMVPLTANIDGSDHNDSGGFTAGTLSRRSSKSSTAHVRVPVPGDTTFISYKTSLQDYCQKVGWLAPMYNTQQISGGYQSKVTFGGHSYDTGLDFAASKQEAEQKAAFLGLVGLTTLDSNTRFSSDACISVPSPGDASFISYKCSLHDFCQQCNILPPRFTTSKHDTGYTSSVTVGSHTFNMSGRVANSQEAEQKGAFIALLGLCMTDSQAIYNPEACFTVPGPADANFISFKSSLHDFCQRYKLPPPQYITNQGSQGYSAKLKFGGLFFQSSDYFQTRLEAEQHAAFEALQGLGLLESSVDFVAVSESSQSNGSTHGGSFIAVGSIGGNVPSNYNSRQNSRPASRSASKASSRQASRPSSRPGSRQGSTTQLNDIDTNFNMSTTYDTPRRDPSYSIGSRSYSSVGGFNSNRGMTAEVNAAHYATVGRSGNTTPRSNQYPGYNEGGVSYNYSSNIGSQNTTSTSNRYNTIGRTSFDSAPSTSLYNTNSNTSSYNARNRTQSYDTAHEYKTADGNASTFSYSMTYERHTTTKGAGNTSTLPRNKLSVPGVGETSSSNILSPRRTYGSAQNVAHETIETKNIRSSSSHSALPDLELEMAGLEGLIKDLNGITGSRGV